MFLLFLQLQQLLWAISVNFPPISLLFTRLSVPPVPSAAGLLPLGRIAQLERVLRATAIGLLVVFKI